MRVSEIKKQITKYELKSRKKRPRNSIFPKLKKAKSARDLNVQNTFTWSRHKHAPTFDEKRTRRKCARIRIREYRCTRNTTMCVQDLRFFLLSLFSPPSRCVSDYTRFTTLRYGTVRVTWPPRRRRSSYRVPLRASFDAGGCSQGPLVTPNALVSYRVNTEFSTFSAGREHAKLAFVYNNIIVVVKCKKKSIFCVLRIVVYRSLSRAFGLAKFVCV